MKQGWLLLRRKLNGTTTRSRLNSNLIIATVDSCFDLVGSRQHGVAARSKATACLIDLLLNAQGKTTAHGYNSWLSVWTLSCRHSVKFSTLLSPLLHCHVSIFGRSGLLQILPTLAAFSFAVSLITIIELRNSVQYLPRMSDCTSY